VAPKPGGDSIGMTQFVELDTVTCRWQRAFDAGDHALAAANDLLPAAALQH